jgi:hypothetical protein
MKSIIIPILNKKVLLIQGPPILLSNDYSIEKISDDEFSAFFRTASEEIKANLNLNTTKCIKVKCKDPDKDKIRSSRTKAVFTLNIFADSNPIVTSWAGHLVGDKKINLKSITDFESLAAFHKISGKTYKFISRTKRETIIQFFQIVEKASISNPSVLFTMEKYNSALLRDDFFDKLLDATICFETMMPGNTELVYRLSQNISFIAGSSATEKLEIFDNMKKLYDVRSKLVHGDLKSKGTDKKIKEVQDNWSLFEKYLKSTVTYYLLFLSTNKKEDWENHLKEIVLGTQNKII